MNTGEKIDYMIQCLQVAKAECEYLDEWIYLIFWRYKDCALN